MIKSKKPLFLFFLVLFLITLIKEIYYCIIYVYNISLNRANKIPMLKLVNLNRETQLMLKKFYKIRYKLKKWVDNIYIFGLKIKSFDKVTLFAEYFKNNTNKWVIIVHGYGANGRMMYSTAKKFYEKGYNIILPDLRGHGLSGGNYIGMGWHDRIDLIYWIKKILKIDKNAKIVLYGVSMGASSVLMCSGENLPQNVKCIIADCGFTSAYEIFKYQMKNIFSIPSFPLLNILNIICKNKNKYCLKKASALKQVKKTKIPIFFIHGEKDNFVPISMALDLYKNTKSNKKLMIFKEAFHGVSSIIEENIYWESIFKFIKNNAV